MSTVGLNPYTAFQAIKPSETASAQPSLGNAAIQGAGDFRAALQDAERAAMNTAVNGADPHAMVTALANAELALDTVVTIRNKVVEAYQELLRMPV
jgi:flagellar hook-basal body complex protein FliE